MIEIRRHTHAKKFISLSGAYLEANESENNWLISLADRLAEDPDAYGPKSVLLLSILEGGSVVGAAVMIPRQRIILSKIGTGDPQVVMPQLVRYLRQADVEIPGVFGPAVAAEAFSDSWIQDVSGVSAQVAMQMRAFEARAVADLPMSPGTLRLAWTTIRLWRDGIPPTQRRYSVNLVILRMPSTLRRDPSRRRNSIFGMMGVPFLSQGQIVRRKTVSPFTQCTHRQSTAVKGTQLHLF